MAPHILRRSFSFVKRYLMSTQMVDEIDKQVTLLPTRQTQKPRMSQSTEGKLM